MKILLPGLLGESHINRQLITEFGKAAGTNLANWLARRSRLQLWLAKSELTQLVCIYRRKYKKNMDGRDGKPA